eukprot:scaffold35286_cov30-Prasinocladus_malaysianus.AAC.2
MSDAISVVESASSLCPDYIGPRLLFSSDHIAGRPGPWEKDPREQMMPLSRADILCKSKVKLTEIHGEVQPQLETCGLKFMLVATWFCAVASARVVLAVCSSGSSLASGQATTTF